MAEAYKTDKEFLIIKTSNVEVVGLGGVGICDACNIASHTGYIISVLAGRWYCPECYEKWHLTAINYEEDRAYEKATFEKFLKTFSLTDPTAQ